MWGEDTLRYPQRGRKARETKRCSQSENETDGQGGMSERTKIESGETQQSQRKRGEEPERRRQEAQRQLALWGTLDG